MNETDLCVGPFFLSSEQLTLSQFTTPVYDGKYSKFVSLYHLKVLQIFAMNIIARLYVISYKDSKEDLSEELLTPLVPFTYEAWGVILAVSKQKVFNFHICSTN